MKTFILSGLLVFTSSIFGGFAFAKVTPADLTPAYIALQDALAKDDLSAANTAGNNLAESLASHSLIGKSSGESKMIGAAKLIGTAKTIKAARAQFKLLSREFILVFEKAPVAGYVKAYCPMAGAKWVQKDGDISNPYYGKQMLTCGEKLK